VSQDRPRRVGELIQRELAVLIPKELQHAELGLVTISAVDVSPDLKNAKVFFTVIGGHWTQAQTLEYLEQHAGHLRFFLAKRMTTRVTPKLMFAVDHSLEDGMRMDALLHSLHSPK